MKWDGSECVGEQFRQGDQHIGLPKCKSLLVQRWEQGTVMDEKARHAQLSQQPPCCARACPQCSWVQLRSAASIGSHPLSFPGCHTCTLPQTLPSFPVLKKGLGKAELSPAILSAVHHLKLIIPHQLPRPDASTVESILSHEIIAGTPSLLLSAFSHQTGV